MNRESLLTLGDRRRSESNCVDNARETFFPIIFEEPVFEPDTASALCVAVVIVSGILRAQFGWM
jgi:hypothetical protein